MFTTIIVCRGGEPPVWRSTHQWCCIQFLSLSSLFTTDFSLQTPHPCSSPNLPLFPILFTSCLSVQRWTCPGINSEPLPFGSAKGDSLDAFTIICLFLYYLEPRSEHSSPTIFIQSHSILIISNHTDPTSLLINFTPSRSIHPTTLGCYRRWSYHCKQFINGLSLPDTAQFSIHKWYFLATNKTRKPNIQEHTTTASCQIVYFSSSGSNKRFSSRCQSSEHRASC